MRIFVIYAHFTISIQSFFMQYSKMRIEIGGWKRSKWNVHMEEIKVILYKSRSLLTLHI